jgi:very-short-patch-repair endonuclease
MRSGWLRTLHRGVFLVGPIAGPHAAEWAALLTCGEHAAVSHVSAAGMWRIRARTEGSVHVTVTRGHRRPQAGIRVHHAKLEVSEVRRCDGLWITSPVRTLLDLATTVSSAELDRAVNEAQVLGLTTAAEIQSYLARYPSRRGSRALRRALHLEPRVSRSRLERTMLALIRRVGLPLPLTEVVVEGHLVDFFWPAHRLIVETDGFQAHGTRPRFERDRARDAQLVAAGYRVLRFTWRQLDGEPEIVAARLAAALAR